MQWYYAEANERHGPLDDAQFDELVRTGRVGPATQVWREGWDNWRPWSEALGENAGDGNARCVNCGASFPAAEMVQYQGSFVCPNCKPVFFQKVKEGLEPAVALHYAGFWMRFLAKFVDGIILNIPGYAFQFAFAPLTRNPDTIWLGVGLGWLCSFLVGLTYYVGLNGKYGATLGKMACGLRIVTPEGAPISYAVAAGRYFGEILSSIIFLIGYIMAAFDDEKRALHDRICNTRVIRRSA